MRNIARAGVDPGMAVKTLADYGDIVMPLAVRGLERKTLDPYMAGWHKRVVPALGHLAVRMISYGVVDRAVYGWIADGCSRSTIKNSLAILVRVLEQAVRDGIIDRNPARITGWQREYQLAEDELDDPRSLALPDWDALEQLAAALVARSADQFPGWGDVVSSPRAPRLASVRRQEYGAATSTLPTWTWNVRRQTTPGPGGVIDKGTKGKRAGAVPIIAEIRPLVAKRLESSAMTRWPGCSPARAAAGSRPLYCATPRTGTRW